MKKSVKIIIIFLLLIQGVLLNAQNKKAWTSITVPMKETNQLFFWSQDSGYAVDNINATICKTIDGGKNWTSLKKFDKFSYNAYTFGVYTFYDKNTIYACGPAYNATLGYQAGYWFYKTIDGGINWVESSDLTADLQNTPNQLYCFGKDTLVLGKLWAGGEVIGSHFAVSFNGGVTFTNLPNYYSGFVTVFRMGEKILFKGKYSCSGSISGNRWCSKLLVCKNWDSVLSNKYVYWDMPSIDIDRVGKIDDNTLMFYNPTSIGELIVSNDQCENWNTLPLTDPLYEIFTSNKYLYSKWFRNDFSIPVNLNNEDIFDYIYTPYQSGLSYYNKVQKKIFVDSSGFGKRPDGGADFYGRKNLSLCFVNDNIAYIGTDSNTILKTTTGGGVEDVFASLSGNGVKSNIVNQNVFLKLYPNPATNKLLVNGYSLNGANTLYYVYSMEGKLLLQGELIEGGTEINTSYLASGMYLFKTSDSFAKFTILK